VIVGRRRRREVVAGSSTRVLETRAQTALSWPEAGSGRPEADGATVRTYRQADGAEGWTIVDPRDEDPLPAPETVIAEQLAAEAPTTIPLLTGPRTVARRARFALVNACTVASLVTGVGAILLAMHSEVRWAAAALLACVLFDGLDGALARKLGVSTEFGAQMDSLADMCSFGIATPVVAFAWLAGPAPVVVIAPVCALVAVCAAIRLARFNVSPKNGRFFSGVPTTIAAAIIVLTVLLRPEPGRWMSAALVACLAVAMVSTFPYFKLGALRRVPVWLWPVAVVAVIVDPSTTLGILVGAYLLSGPLLWARQRRAVTSV
jgi:CDP-diacylglycerol--serine O-phosphatidyltransferase